MVSMNKARKDHFEFNPVKAALEWKYKSPWEVK